MGSPARDLGPPASYLILEKGMPVYSSDGERVGRIEEVRADPNADVFDGLAFASGTVPPRRHLIEADLVDEIHERGVILKLDAERARALPPPGDGAGQP